ncbi:GNAT family N-acetyltransferase [Elioraea sp.]|uniref:GNAT family N-acetyltransferase n=1 Tax=Elioraea sp. TaxID=2185103 RepID=UPI00307F8CDD
MSVLRLTTVTGEALRPHLADVARLRIAVFREWPYLYDGDAAYEERYLGRYATAPGAAIVLAFDGDRAVGASTCLPLAEEGEAVQSPFRAAGWDLRRVFYFGESVLLPEYRGRGAGVGFFVAREAHARRFPGIDTAAFCAVMRDPADPRRPAGYVPLDSFWRRRGYVPAPDLVCTMSWKEIGATEETPHELAFWLKRLPPEAA